MSMVLSMLFLLFYLHCHRIDGPCLGLAIDGGGSGCTNGLIIHGTLMVMTRRENGSTY